MSKRKTVSKKRTVARGDGLFRGSLRPVSEFRESLLQVMDRKNHWAWVHFSGNTISKEQLKIHFQQEYAVYVRDFPVFLSRIHGKNPPMEVRHDLAANIYEEDTGGLSVGRPHPELFLNMMSGLGFRRGDFSNVKLLPASRRYRIWLDEVTTSYSWLAAAGVITIFVEGSINDRKECDPAYCSEPEDLKEKIRLHPLVQYHGLDPGDMDLVKAHHQIEGSHRHAAWKMVLDHSKTPQDQRSVHQALLKSLRLWLNYRDGIAKACGLKK